MISSKILRGITHSCIYMGNNYVLDTDAKIIQSGYEIEKITLETLIRNKIKCFGGVHIYVVTPIYHGKFYRKRAVEESKSYLHNRHRIHHSYVASFITGWRYIFFRKTYYPEDLSFKGNLHCSEMAARILKKSGAKIGRRATYNFVPTNFLFSKYFKTRNKVILR